MNQTVQLSRVVDVLPGYPVKARVEHDPDGAFQVVIPRHLGDEPVYAYKDEHALRMNLEGRPDRYLIAPGDVLFVSRGMSNRATYVARIPDATVSTAVFYVLRPRRDLDPRYLTWYLNQAPTQMAIGQIRTGAGTPIVQRKALMELSMPVPDLATQRRIADVFELMNRERRLCQRLVDCIERQHRLLSQELLNGTMRLPNRAETDPDLA